MITTAGTEVTDRDYAPREPVRDGWFSAFGNAIGCALCLGPAAWLVYYLHVI